MIKTVSITCSMLSVYALCSRDSNSHVHLHDVVWINKNIQKKKRINVREKRKKKETLNRKHKIIISDVKIAKDKQVLVWFLFILLQCFEHSWVTMMQI